MGRADRAWVAGQLGGHARAPRAAAERNRSEPELPNRLGSPGGERWRQVVCTLPHRTHTLTYILLYRSLSLFASL